MTDRSFDDTERRVRDGLQHLADGHHPEPGRHWPASHPAARGGPVRPSSTRRRVLAAASVVAVAAGFVAVAVVQRGGDAVTDPAPLPTAVVDPVDDPTTTVRIEPPVSVPATVPVEDLAGVRFPVDSAELAAQWMVPWADGFLVGALDSPAEADGESTIRARFTTDGESWEPVEMSLPPGVRGVGRVLSVGGRFVMADSFPSADGGVVVRVASTTDLRNWSWQDFEVPAVRPQADQNEPGAAWSSLRSFAANTDGWVFEVVRIHGWDVTDALPGDAQRRISDGAGYQIRSDDSGFTVAVDGPGDSPPTAESTYTSTWDEVGIGPETVPYLTGELPISLTWAATWDGTPALADTVLPEGPTLASPDGFVRWNDHTWFSADGLSWSPSPLPDPTGTVMNAFPVDGGFVAIVANQRGTTDAYRLDTRGGAPRPIDVDGLPERLVTGWADRTLSGLASPPPSAAVLAGGLSPQTPLVIDSNGYRYVERTNPSRTSVIDLETGETVVSHALFRPPAADTAFRFGHDGLTVTDPTTETVLMQIPIGTYQAARRSLVEYAGGVEAVPNLLLLAGGDGEAFLLEALRSSSPDADDGRVTVATNGGVVLTRLGDEWIRFDLPS